MREFRSSGSVRGASSNGRPLYVAGSSAGDHIRWMTRRAVSACRPFGATARAVDPAPLLPAPLFRLDGILGHAFARSCVQGRSMRSTCS